jgi:hypothetical protein
MNTILDIKALTPRLFSELPGPETNELDHVQLDSCQTSRPVFEYIPKRKLIVQGGFEQWNIVFEGSRESHIGSFAFFGAYVIHVSTRCT